MVSRAKLECNARYRAKWGFIQLRVSREERKEIKRYAANKGKSLNEYVTGLIADDMSKK